MAEVLEGMRKLVVRKGHCLNHSTGYIMNINLQSLRQVLSVRIVLTTGIQFGIQDI